LRAEGLLTEPCNHGHIAVKEAVLPFNRFPEVDTLLGPEMRSTGEVMGIDVTFGLAFAKSQTAAGNHLPRNGTVFFSLADRDKAAGLEAARRFTESGFSIAATRGTADFLESEGIPVATVVAKVAKIGKLTETGTVTKMGTVNEEKGEDAVALIASGKIDLVVNTPRGKGSRADGWHIRQAATINRVSCLTTVSAAVAAANGMAERAASPLTVRSLQEYHGQ
jgi:carbamoyl-phosphate synthase large subunit